MSRSFVLLVGVLGLLALSGCRGVAIGSGWPESESAVAGRSKGPPPHAPAHGHRHKHEAGVELRFDSGLGVYVVVGSRDVYFHDGWFIRIDGDGWQVGTSLEGPWQPRSADAMPPGLGSQRRAKGKGRGAAKGRW